MPPPPEPLPHVYPFRFADRTLERTGRGEGRVRATITVNTPGAGFPAVYLAELMAQAVLLLEGGDPEIGRSGFLAGFSDFEVERVPEPGDVLTVEVRIAGRLGPVVKFEGAISDDRGANVARGALTVRKGTP